MKRMAACALIGLLAHPAMADVAPVPRSGLGQGYLSPVDLPDSEALLPPPPAEGSKALSRDDRAAGKALKLRDTPRWDLAKVDADLFNAKATGTMSCAAGYTISAEATPATYALLRRAVADLGAATGKAKRKYMRKRPFVLNGQPQCTPEWDAILRADGSYPSGHAAIGVGWGLILGDVFPARRAALLKRGRAFADSRRICNVHFLSDVEAGGVVAKAVVAKLRTDPKFRDDLAAARAEAKTAKPAKSECAAEKAALRLSR